jgi:hypothetical protein
MRCESDQTILPKEWDLELVVNDGSSHLGYLLNRFRDLFLGRIVANEWHIEVGR